MKYLALMIFAIGCSSAESTRRSNNYPDNIDANNVPAALEERQEEEINFPDYIDDNDVPAIKEQRKKSEVMDHKNEDFLDDDSYWE
jgi:hypothetical protein